MTLLARLVVEYSDPGAGVKDRVESLLKEILLPKTINRLVLQRYLRRALNNGSWHTLARAQRSLLWLSARTLDYVKSPVLDHVLRNILLKIELATFRARALYYGILVYMKKYLVACSITVEHVLAKIKQIFYLGVDYINNPLVHTTYR